MEELLRSNDLVFLSYVQAMLRGEGIECLLLDDHISSVEGSMGAFPRRLMVNSDDFREAKALLANLSLTSPD